MSGAPLRARPLERDDLAALEPLDRGYAERFDVEPVTGAASLSLYARSGHSFVVERGARIVGFVLAQAVWTGARPVVRLARLAVPAEVAVDAADAADAAGEAGEPAEGGEARRLLVEALTKSAYDAAVYDLEAVVPDPDRELHAALEGFDYRPRPARVYTRVLGSRGEA